MGLDVRTYGNIKLAENEDDYAFTAFVIDDSWKHKIKNLKDGKCYTFLLSSCSSSLFCNLV